MKSRENRIARTNGGNDQRIAGPVRGNKNQLLTELAIARGDGSSAKQLASFAKIDLLLIDDWGMTAFFNYRSATRLARDLGRSLQHPFNAGDESTVRREIARHDRRFHLRRRHPRSSRSQRLQVQTERRIDQKNSSQPHPKRSQRGVITTPRR